MLELGECLEDGVKREVMEETGLRVHPLAALSPVDRIQKCGNRVQYHYVIIDFVCRPGRGRLKPASDVLDARWVEREDLRGYHLTRKAVSIIADAFAWLESRDRPRVRKRH
jgi:8-oxo-dGTP diphosphatase